jgi:hypothetical protein
MLICASIYIHLLLIDFHNDEHSYRYYHNSLYDFVQVLFFSSWTRIDVKRKESESLALDDLRCCQMNEGRMDCFSVSFFLVLLLLLILSLDCRHQKTSKGRLDMVTFNAFSFSLTKRVQAR